MELLDKKFYQKQFPKFFWINNIATEKINSSKKKKQLQRLFFLKSSQYQIFKNSECNIKIYLKNRVEISLEKFSRK